MRPRVRPAFALVIGDLALRWTVTALFGVSIVGYLHIVAAQHIRWVGIVKPLLHLTMSVAMIVMAWPIGMNLPTLGPMIFFLIAAIWFALVPGRLPTSILDRVTNGYHAVKITAMAWMYAVMSGILTGHAYHSPEHTMTGSAHPQSAGMDMAGPGMLGAPGWITTVNSIATVGFAAATLYWLYRHFVERRLGLGLGPLWQAFMAAGTTIMFAAML